MKSLPLTALVLAATTLAGSALVGCQGSSKSMASHPVSPEVLEQLRAEFTQADAGARLGSVDEVLSTASLLKVGQITGSDFPVNTYVAIIDSNKQVVANGKVVQNFTDAAHVRYEKKGTREPKVGDVAVKFTEKF